MFDPGTVFPSDELTLRVLSLFWGDCCCPPYFCRAPAPVVQFAGPAGGHPARPVRAWWLRENGIEEDPEGPLAAELRPFFQPAAEVGRRWPRYESWLSIGSTAVEMIFHRGGLASLGHRTRLLTEFDGRLRVLEREPWWVR